MNRRDLRTAEAEWRATPKHSARRPTARREPLTIGRILRALFGA